jgi:hypothetical protein
MENKAFEGVTVVPLGQHGDTDSRYDLRSFRGIYSKSHHVTPGPHVS